MGVLCYLRCSLGFNTEVTETLRALRVATEYTESGLDAHGFVKKLPSQNIPLAGADGRAQLGGERSPRRWNEAYRQPGRLDDGGSAPVLSEGAVERRHLAGYRNTAALFRRLPAGAFPRRLQLRLTGLRRRLRRRRPAGLRRPRGRSRPAPLARNRSHLRGRGPGGARGSQHGAIPRGQP